MGEPNLFRDDLFRYMGMSGDAGPVYRAATDDDLRRAGWEPRDEGLAALFPEWATSKGVHDVLHHLWACFDPAHPGYAPRFQRGALISLKELLGVDVTTEAAAYEADTIAASSPGPIERRVFEPKDRG